MEMGRLGDSLGPWAFGLGPFAVLALVALVALQHTVVRPLGFGLEPALRSGDWGTGGERGRRGSKLDACT